MHWGSAPFLRPDQVDALVEGRCLDDTPPAYGRLAQLLAEARVSSTALDDRSLPQLLERLPRPRRNVRSLRPAIGLGAASIAAAVTAGAGAAAAGVLPQPVQGRVSAIASAAGISVPAGSRPAPSGADRNSSIRQVDPGTGRPAGRSDGRLPPRGVPVAARSAYAPHRPPSAAEPGAESPEGLPGRDLPGGGAPQSGGPVGPLPGGRVPADGAPSGAPAGSAQGGSVGRPAGPSTTLPVRRDAPDSLPAGGARSGRSGGSGPSPTGGTPSAAPGRMPGRGPGPTPGDG